MQWLKKVFLDTSLFRLLYIISFFFCMVMYTDRVAYAFVFALFVWGLFLTVYTIVKYKAYSKMYFSIWLFAFLISFSITVVININSNPRAVLYNLFMLMHASICFFVFYGMHIQRGLPFKWELYLITRVIVYLSTVFTLVGLILMLFTAGMYDSYFLREGVFKGFYVNPNYQGYVSALSIIFCHMLIKPNFIADSGQKRVSRIWLVSCVVFNSIALLLCDSNASLLLIVVYVAITLLMKLFAMVEKLTPGKILLRLVCLILAGLAILSFMMFVRVACRIGVAAFSSGDKGLDPKLVSDLVSEIFFVPSKDTGYTSRKFLWDAGARIFSQHPVFGIGKGNLYDAIIEVTGRTNFNSGYYGFEQISCTDLHNGYLTLLTTSGVIGTLFFTVFFIRCIMMTFPVWFVQRRIMTYSVYPCLLAYIVAYLPYAFIEKTILFDTTFLVMSFWLVLGYTACYARYFGYERRGVYTIFGRSVSKRLL